MTTIPDFYTLNQQQKPAGTYDLYASCNGVSAESWPEHLQTATITICQWEQHPRIKSKTRVHRTSSVLKAKVSADLHKRQLEILEAAVEALSKGEIIPAELPLKVEGVKSYGELSITLIERGEYWKDIKAKAKGIALDVIRQSFT